MRPGRSSLRGSGRATAPDGCVSTVPPPGARSPAPAGRLSTDGASAPDRASVDVASRLFVEGAVPASLPVRCDGSTGVRGSRPRKIRDRRKSSSNGTPGVLSAAPVGASGTRIERGPFTRPPTPFGLPPPPATPVGVAPVPPELAALGTLSRRGRSSISGVDSTTRRAVRSSTGRPLSLSRPKFVRGTRVTPRHVL